jgi:hypothetical protein
MPDNNRASTFSFDDPHWRPFAREKLDMLHVTPNELWFNTTTKAGALIVKQSGQYAEFAISKAGLDHLHDAVRAGRIVAGCIVLVQRDSGAVVLVKDVIEVVADLNGRSPRDGRLGPYWWLNADGTPNTPYYGPGSQPPLPDIPF